jgi:uncharacterized protein
MAYTRNARIIYLFRPLDKDDSVSPRNPFAGKSVGITRVLLFVLAGITSCPAAEIADNASPVAAPRESIAPPSPLRLLFLGDHGPHQPYERFSQLQPVLASRGIVLDYTEDPQQLKLDHLLSFDGLMLYANIEHITPEQESALLEYVAEGGAFIPVHCASYCFLNSPAYVELVGAQFRRHGTGIVHTAIAAPSHPIMQGFDGFSSWDETYVHHRHHESNRTVLEYHESDGLREPWTWTRVHGAGRVFYTAWGHDDRTWAHVGFHNLIERGIRWAVGQDSAWVPPYGPEIAMTTLPVENAPVRYVEANIPYYPAGERWGTMGDAIRQMPLALCPEESQRRYSTPKDFEVQLFASEPDIGKPICMSWDERGRLWIAETVDYPNELRTEGQGRDRIRICEDTTGDGRADKFTVFAEDLSIPTSLAFAHGGVIVHQAPHTLFLRDDDGDDRADTRKILFSGWATNDTHAGPSNMVYGYDNWIWGMVGYAGFAGKIGDEQHSFRTGFYRFRPDGSELEFLRNTNNNSWGFGFSEEGIVFGSTANGNPSEYLPIPNRYYERVRGWSSSALSGIAGSARMSPITDKVRQVDHHGGFTAAAGHALYTARTYPREYWNRTAFVNEPTGHLTATFEIQETGAGYRSRNAWNLLASDDEWSSPIMAEVGPDGHVWVIDWYNYIVQHNPTPAGFETGRGNAYETDLRDKRHGRIYRVVYQPAAEQPRISLANARPEQLVETLRHSNLLWRKHAQRLLVERGSLDIVPQLIQLLSEYRLDAIGLDVGAIHALWTLHGLDVITSKHPDVVASVVKALKHPSSGVQRNAVLALPRTEELLPILLQSGLVQHPRGQLRLVTLLALADSPASSEAAQTVVEAMGDTANLRDRWLVDALVAAAAAQDEYFLNALHTIEASQMAEAIKRHPTELQRMVATVAEHVARTGRMSTVHDWSDALSQTPAPIADALILGFQRGWPQGKPVELDGETEAKLVQVLERLSPESRGQLVNLAARWESPVLARYAAETAALLLAKARDEDESDNKRLLAARQYIALLASKATAVADVLELVTPRVSPDLATGLLVAIRASDAPDSGKEILTQYASWTPSAQRTALSTLLSRAEWSVLLLEAIAEGTVSSSDLTLDQKQGLSSHPDLQLAERARRVLARDGGLPSPDRQNVLLELLPLTEQAGDAQRGKLVFKEQCGKCHVHSGEGTRIGPDLTGMAVHSKAELLTHIIDPSRSVEGNYRSYTVVTVDGRVLQGLLASESKTALELYDTEGKQQLILREDVEHIIASPKSLMPDGFEKQVSTVAIVDLLEFLTERGKFLPLPLAKVATVVSTRGMFYDADATAERIVFEDWNPKSFNNVPFELVDPQRDRFPNFVLLHGPQGKFPPTMPKSVEIPCNTPVKALHLLSGISGWGFPLGTRGSVTMIVRFHYADGGTEDHPLRNGEHFADYVREIDVPESQLAFNVGGRQVRYLAVVPRRSETVERIELRKGDDSTAPVVVAATVEIP